MTDTPKKIGLITVAFGKYRLFDRLEDKTADATAYIRADIHEAAVAALEAAEKAAYARGKKDAEKALEEQAALALLDTPEQERDE